MFENVISHRTQIRFLKSLEKNQRIPNSMIFSGMEGIGKFLVAMRFVRYVLCSGSRSSACECSLCKKIEFETLFDVKVILPENGLIGIPQIRNVQKVCELVPYEAPSRFILFDDAHLMNVQAANALLKLLEEPPPKTKFILITSDISKILETVQSRSFVIGFHPLPVKDIQDYLKISFSLSEEKAVTCSRLCNGSLRQALNLAITDTNSEDSMKEVIDLLLSGSVTQQFQYFESNKEVFNFEHMLSQLNILLLDALSVKKGSTGALISFGHNFLILKLVRGLSLKELLSLNEKVMETLERYRTTQKIHIMNLLFNWKQNAKGEL